MELAQELGLAGHVRNELDGSVTVFVQDDGALVDGFIERIKSSLSPVVVREGLEGCVG